MAQYEILYGESGQCYLDAYNPTIADICLAQIGSAPAPSPLKCCSSLASKHALHGSGLDGSKRVTRRKAGPAYYHMHFPRRVTGAGASARG
jgi:hypothetical protein